MRSVLAMLPLIPQLVVLSHASAQKGEPFTATVSMTRKVLAVGECSAVSLALREASTQEWPRGPNGSLVTMADFDLSVSAPAARAAVGQYDGPNSFRVCACPKAPVGTVATVTATYPSKWIAPKVRVPGVSFSTTTSAPIAAGASSGNPPGCDAPNASAGGPWTVTIQPSVSALAIGSCSAVSLTIRDSTGKTTPRNPAGTLVSIADFEMSATSANGADVVGTQYSPSSFSACACQTGTVGEAATITAKYPGSQLDPKARAPHVEMQATAPLTLAAARGSTNPPGCGLKQRAIASIAPRSAASAGSVKAEAAQSTAASGDPREQAEASSAGGAATAGAAGAVSQKAGDAQGSVAGSDPRAQEEAPSAGGAATAGAAGAASQKAGDAQGSASGSDPRAQGEAPSAGGAATAGAASQKAADAQGNTASGDPRAQAEAPSAGGAAAAGAAGAAGAASQKAGDAQGTAAAGDPRAQADAPGAVATAPASRGAPSALKGPLAVAPSTTKSTPSTAPAPTGVAVAWTRGVAHVTWNSVNGAQRYAVWRANGTASSVERTPSAYSLTQFADSIADLRQTYRYVVIAYFADGSKGASATVQFTASPKGKP
jgi:hypothetical protein